MYCEENTAFEYNHVRVNDLHNTWKLCNLLITKVYSLSEDAIYAIYRRVYEKVSFDDLIIDVLHIAGYRYSRMLYRYATTCNESYTYHHRNALHCISLDIALRCETVIDRINEYVNDPLDTIDDEALVLSHTNYSIAKEQLEYS